MNSRELIEDLYLQFLQRRKEIFNLIHQHEDEIDEIDKFFNSLSVLDEDYSIFSPFKADELSDGKVSRMKERREELHNEIDTQYQVIDEIDTRIAQFKEILSSEELKNSVPSGVEIDEDTSLTNFSDDAIDVANSNSIELAIIDIQEKERQRIANELHDTSVQNLVHLIHCLELTSKFIDQDPIRAKLEIETCSKDLRKTIDGIRETIFNLRPMSLSDLGFQKGIENFMDNLKLHYPNVVFNYEIEDIGNSFEKNIVLFRIIQECVNNSLKHSQSDNLFLKITRNDSVCDIIVRDTGVGFNMNEIKRNHFGLAILQDRVKLLHGKISIDSNADGTQINISIPM